MERLVTTSEMMGISKVSGDAPCVFLLLYYCPMLTFDLGKFPSHQRGNQTQNYIREKQLPRCLSNWFFLVNPFLLSVICVSRSKSNTKPVRTSFSNKRIPVLTLYFLGDEWSDCMHLKNVALPEAPFLGFTAMTGDVSDAHEYVISHSSFRYNVNTNSFPPAIASSR
jgi:hypothetical protein